MEFRDRIGKILLVTLVFILAFVAYKRTYHAPAPAAVTSVEQKSDGKSLVHKEEVEKIVREFILDNPSVLIESIERMQQRKADEMNAQVNELIKGKKAELENDKMSPVVGTGNISVVMFYDINCTYCRKANAIVDQLLSANKDVKVIYKPLPLLGESSEYATKIEIAVYKLFPAKFKAVHTAFMADKLGSRDEIVLILDKNAIPVASVEAEFDSPYMKEYIKNTSGIASELRIQGVPNFIIGDSLYPGFIELGRMQIIIDDVRAKTPAPMIAPAVTPKAEPTPSTAPAPEAPAPSAAPAPATTPAPASEVPATPTEAPAPKEKDK